MVFLPKLFCKKSVLLISTECNNVFVSIASSVHSAIELAINSICSDTTDLPST